MTRRARVILETPIGDRRVEPSQGTHFFRNITAARVGYLTVTDEPGSWLDRDWIEGRSGSHDGLHHIELDEPIHVHIDGRRGEAVILERSP